ncbi:MAG: alpha/beta hydrolase [Deltaproteobacteria bacterium]|nr:alpha/beta hydrolase [Deltaproteobacteria bacterium]
MDEMREERVFFGTGGMRLEGLYAPGTGERAALICHPHSLMGGTMETPVVETVAQALFRAGFSTLRFNFRGVGGSDGAFDEGRGEGEDLLSAAAFLEDRGTKAVLPAGYSFGAWVAAGALTKRPFLPALLVAPPVAMFPFELATLRGRVGLIVCGDNDPYCPAKAARAMAAEVSCRVEVLAGEDHFFGRGLERLGGSVAVYAKRLPGPVPNGDRFS